MAYQTGNVSLQAPVKMRVWGEWEGKKVSKILDTTVGRVHFNQGLPQDLGYVDRTNPDTFLDLEVDFTVDKGALANWLTGATVHTVRPLPARCSMNSSVKASIMPRAAR